MSTVTDPQRIVYACAERAVTLATGESLTAGSLAARIAEVSGASAVLRGGVIAYCNAVKHQLLQVDQDLLRAAGAVDPRVAAAMARGAAETTGASIGISTTGVAGPESHAGKEVGTVYIGLACWFPDEQRSRMRLPDRCILEDLSGSGTEQGWSAGSVRLNLEGDRAAIRSATVEAGLKLLEELVLAEPPGQAESR